jgi:hypothetical protein
MELKAETQQVVVISDYNKSDDDKPVELIELMPIARLLGLEKCVRAIYPDVSVSIRPNGDVELRFKEPFYDGLVPERLEKEVASFMAEYDYKV